MPLWLAWALLGALIGIAAAQQRGFPTAAGILGGVLLGPLAFLMFWATGLTKATRTRACPFCAEFVKLDAHVCKHCGRDLPPPTFR